MNAIRSASLITLLLAVLLQGCISNNVGSSSGTPIDPAKVASIVKGKTTRAEVESMFGKPDAATILPDGRRSLSFHYSETNMNVRMNGFAAALPLVPGAMAKTTGTTKTQSLQVFLSKDGIVDDFEFTDNTRDVQGDAMGNTRWTSR